LSPYGDLTLHPKIVTAGQIAGPYEAILLGVKSYSLSSAMDDLAAAVGPETMILPALNGMSHIDALIARFGASAVLGGVCLVATEIDPEGRIRQLADFQKLIYGELDGGDTARVRQLDESLSGAGFDATISSHIVEDIGRNGSSSRAWVSRLASCAATSARLPPSRAVPLLHSPRCGIAPTFRRPAAIRPPLLFSNNKPWR
jgi:Ketopantoate reductase PanE/ApbA